MRSIEQALRQAEYRDKFEIKQHWAVRDIDLQGYLLRYKPDIIHFSGHGSSSSDIILEDVDGSSQSLASHTLSKLFSVLKDNIRCVVLNACYSRKQAQAISKHIDCVIGMSSAISDAAAISFATAFYQALGYGRNIKTAFELGCTEIDSEGLNEQNTPQLLGNNCDKIYFVEDKVETIHQMPKEWAAELISKSAFERTLKITLNEDSHVIYFKHDTSRIINRNIVKVNDKLVIEGGGIFTQNLKLEFDIIDGSERYRAIVGTQFTLTDRIKKFRLYVSGRLLYED